MTQNANEMSSSPQPAHPHRVHELVPAVDIYENERELLVVADLPKVTPDRLTVEVNHPDLKIEGRAAVAENGVEIVYSRNFQLDSTIDVGKIEAKISEGILEVHLPKSESYRSRKIEVKSA